jgi:hypothetical protein
MKKQKDEVFFDPQPRPDWNWLVGVHRSVQKERWMIPEEKKEWNRMVKAKEYTTKKFCAKLDKRYSN